MNTLTDIGLIKPGDIAFYKTKAGFLGAKYAEKEYPRVTLSRAMPFTDPESFISVREQDGEKEIGILRSLNDFPADQKALLREALRLRYFTPQILELRSVKDKMGYLYIEARVEGGTTRLFAVKDYSRSLRLISERRLMITDIEGNRYTVEDMQALDAKSRRRIEPYLL